MSVALRLGLTRLTCVYNVHLVKKHKDIERWMNSPKKSNLDKLDRQIEEFKSKKHKNSPKRLKVQNDGWRMVIELVTGMILGVSLGMALDYYWE